MKFLEGLHSYLEEHYEDSVFDRALASDAPWAFALHAQKTHQGNLVDNQIYDIRLRMEDGEENLVPKVTVKYCFPAAQTEAVERMVKIDKKVRAKKLEPLFAPHLRYFIKNKSLYPLMKEKTVVFVTLVEGEIIRGLITAFSRYDLTISMKGGLPLTILRHSIFDIRDKKGRCYLKSFQEKARDWQKSALFVDA